MMRHQFTKFQKSKYLSRTKTLVAVLLFSYQGSVAFADENDGKAPIDWLKRLAENGQRALDDSKPGSFKKFIPSENFDLEYLSKQV